MHTIRQLLRQPARTIAGILLVALAVSILSICTGQLIAADSTMRALDRQFNTVALTTPEYYENKLILTNFYTGKIHTNVTELPYIPEEVLTRIERLIAENPDIVKLDSRPGLASAYIPELTADNHTRHDFYIPRELSPVEYAASVVPAPFGAPYTCALLTITVTSSEEEMAEVYNRDKGTTEIIPKGNLIVKGSIDQVHALQDGYHDPTGWTAWISLSLEKTGTGGQDPALSVGDRLLVYTTSYYDADWKLRNQIKKEYAERVYGADKVHIEAFDPEMITYLSEAEIARNKANNPYNYYVAKYIHGYKPIDLTESELEAIRSIYMADPEWMVLNGTAEDFLALPEGAQWADYLEYTEINSHAFPVIGVDRLGYIAAFAQETARIVEGRDFTQEELESGAKVCVMAQSLAMANGITVGDTIAPRYYNFDPEMEGQYLVRDGWGTTNPAAYFYGESTPFAGEAEEYTVVGLYRYNSEWNDPQEDIFSFTPNTIFVPKNSVTGTMDYSDLAFFRTIVLENGKIPDFMGLVDEAGYEGLFVCYDQGYSDIAGTFRDYEETAKRTALIGMLVYCAVLLLFLLLFPARHGKTLDTMDSLGAKRGRKIRHVVVSSLGILIPGTLIGAVTGMLLWERVSNMLLLSSDFMPDVEFHITSILLVSLAQFVPALCIVGILSLLVSRNKNLITRK